MKDKFAFEESVFNKSEIIFAKRKKRRKTALTMTASCLCVLFTFTILLRLPFGFDGVMPLNKKAFEALAPAQAENAGGHFYNKEDSFESVMDASGDYDKKAETEAPRDTVPVTTAAAVSTVAPAETQAPAEESIPSETEVPEIADKTPLLVEITVFGSTVTVYKDEKDMENIRLSLIKYFELEEKSDVAEANVTFIYSNEKACFDVGREFLEILKEAEK